MSNGEKDWNSQKRIIAWMKSALGESVSRGWITAAECEMLYEVGLQLVQKGAWRGNISEAWKQLGYGSGKVYDLYL